MTRTHAILAGALALGAAAAATLTATDSGTEAALAARARILFTADGRGEIEPCG